MQLNTNYCPTVLPNLPAPRAEVASEGRLTDFPAINLKRGRWARAAFISQVADDARVPSALRDRLARARRIRLQAASVYIQGGMIEAARAIVSDLAFEAESNNDPIALAFSSWLLDGFGPDGRLAYEVYNEAHPVDSCPLDK